MTDDQGHNRTGFHYEVLLQGERVPKIIPRVVVEVCADI